MGFLPFESAQKLLGLEQPLVETWLKCDRVSQVHLGGRSANVGNMSPCFMLYGFPYTGLGKSAGIYQANWFLSLPATGAVTHPLRPPHMRKDVVVEAIEQRVHVHTARYHLQNKQKKYTNKYTGHHDNVYNTHIYSSDVALHFPLLVYAVQCTR